MLKPSPLDFVQKVKSKCTNVKYKAIQYSASKLEHVGCADQKTLSLHATFQTNLTALVSQFIFNRC